MSQNVLISKRAFLSKGNAYLCRKKLSPYKEASTELNAVIGDFSNLVLNIHVIS